VTWRRRIHPRRATAVAAALLAAVLPAGCTPDRAPDVAASSATAPAGATTSAPPASSASAAAPVTPGGSGCVTRTLAGMTDAQRVGQLFVVGLRTTSMSGASATASTAARLHVGNYLLYGGTTAGVAEVRRLTTRVDAMFEEASGVRPFVATDQEGGYIQSLSGPGFERIPTAVVQGGWSTRRLRTSAARWGGQLHDAGVNLDFAPVADVVPAQLATANQPIGRYQREYGHLPATVSPHVAAFVTGLQSAGVTATAKHFPGLGRVIGNTDVASGVTDARTSAHSVELEPFQAAVDAGVGVVMLSSAVYPAIDPSGPAVFSPAVISLLRDQLGFTGLVASDDLGAAEQVGAVAPAERARRFVAAGGQLIVVVRPPSVVAPMVAGVLADARRDPSFRAAVDSAVTEILRVKQSQGLLTCS
jgi:beta-N-acetylhexosaminidase